MSAPSPPIEAVLVYDGTCPQCSLAARLLHSTPRVAPLPWEQEAAQVALREQFREAPRATALFDRGAGQVYAGPATLAELGDRDATASLGDRFAGPEHEHVEGGVGDATDHDVRQVTGIHPLSGDARARMPALIAAAQGSGVDD